LQKNYATVLELLLRLRQACNHPLLVLNAFAKMSKEKITLSENHFFNDNVSKAFLENIKKKYFKKEEEEEEEEEEENEEEEEEEKKIKMKKTRKKSVLFV